MVLLPSFGEFMPERGRALLNLLSELTPNGNSTTGSGSRCHNEEVDEDFPESEYILSSTGISGKNLKV